MKKSMRRKLFLRGLLTGSVCNFCILPSYGMIPTDEMNKSRVAGTRRFFEDLQEATNTTQPVKTVQLRKQVPQREIAEKDSVEKKTTEKLSATTLPVEDANTNKDSEERLPKIQRTRGALQRTTGTFFKNCLENGTDQNLVAKPPYLQNQKVMKSFHKTADQNDAELNKDLNILLQKDPIVLENEVNEEKYQIIVKGTASEKTLTKLIAEEKKAAKGLSAEQMKRRTRECQNPEIRLLREFIYYNNGLEDPKPTKKTDQIPVEKKQDIQKNPPLTRKEAEKTLSLAQRRELANEWIRIYRTDGEKALQHYMLRTDQKRARALYNLGLMYEYGSGVEKNETEASRYFKLAANQGDIDVQYNIGIRHAQGKRIKKNEKEASRCFKLAADGGHANAQYILGAMYEAGRGVERDEKEASRYFQLAATQGHVGAQSRVRRKPALANKSQPPVQEHKPTQRPLPTPPAQRALHTQPLLEITKPLSFSFDEWRQALLIVTASWGKAIWEQCTTQTLTVLDLSNNGRGAYEGYKGIGDEGIKALMLGNFRALKKLNLTNNNIGPEGITTLVKSNPPLIWLILDTNKLRDEGVINLARGKFFKLTGLNLKNNNVGPEGTKALGNGNFPLTWLNLSSNKLGDEGAINLARGNFPTLTGLNLENNRIMNKGAKALGSGNLAALTMLALDSNGIREKGILKLVSGNLSTLRDLTLGNNAYISDLAKKQLTQKIGFNISFGHSLARAKIKPVNACK